MHLPTALTLLEHHYRHARTKHQETKDRVAYNRLLMARITDLDMATADANTPHAKLIAGKRALQVAALALCAIEALDLGLVGPGYDSTALPHTNV
jgi:hypothetical protein